MAEGKKRVPLFSGLIAEGLKGGIDAFMQLTKEEQVKTVNSYVDSFVKVLDDIQLKSSSLRSVTFRKRIMDIINEIRQEVQIIKEEATEDPVHAFIRVLMFPVFLLYELSTFIWGEFFNFLRARFEPAGPVSFDEAIHNAEEFLTLAGDFNILATIFDTIGEIQILGSKLPGQSIARFIQNVSWTFGIGWLTWVVMGPVLRFSIADPYEKEITKRVRPRDFTKSEVEDLYEWGLRKLEELYEGYVVLGYSDDKIEQLMEILRKRVFSSEVRSWITQLEGNYADGYVSDEEFIKMLQLGYFTEDEVKFRYWKAKQRQFNKLQDLRVKEIERAFKEKRIDEDEATARLSEFIKSPEMVERLIALWKQYLKPEEEVEPAERLKVRKQILETRIKGLNDQIAYLQKYLQERLELYDAMIRELENRYQARIQRIADQYDIRIAAIQDEFAKWKEKRLEEIDARLKALQDKLSRFIQIHMADFTGNLQKISDETFSAAGLNRDVILNMFVNGQFDDLLNALTTLALYITAKEKTALDQLLTVLDQYYDLVSRYQLLQTIEKLRIEEREARVSAMIQKLQAEKMAKIQQLQSELADKKEILEKKKELEKIRTESRIAKLQSKVDELSIELTSINKQLEQTELT